VTLCRHGRASGRFYTSASVDRYGHALSVARFNVLILHGSQHGMVIAPSGKFKITVYNAVVSQLGLPAFRTFLVLRPAHQCLPH